MGNKKKNVSLQEFKDIAKTLREVPQKAGEDQREYFDRLAKFYLKIGRSRYVLQKVTYAIKQEPNDIEKAFEIYKSKTEKDNEKNKSAKEKTEEDVDKEQYKWVQALGLLRRQNEMLQEQIDLLKQMSNKMAFIVEQLS